MEEAGVLYPRYRLHCANTWLSPFQLRDSLSLRTTVPLWATYALATIHESLHYLAVRMQGLELEIWRSIGLARCSLHQDQALLGLVYGVTCG